MSDSENWSSYETKSIPDNVKDTSKQDNFQWRQLKNRCMFGAIVGFTSGITFSVGKIIDDIVYTTLKKM